MKCRGIDLKVVYVQRGIKGNVASFIRHDVGFWRGMVIYLLQHSLAMRLLKNSHLDYIVVQYEDLCRDTQETLDHLGEFLGVDYSDYVRKLSQVEYHVLAGNPGTQRQFIQGFEGVTYDDRWMYILRPWQKTLLDWLEPGERDRPTTFHQVHEAGGSR
jgi:hypothetical protein